MAAFVHNVGELAFFFFSFLNWFCILLFRTLPSLTVRHVQQSTSCSDARRDAPNCQAGEIPTIRCPVRACAKYRVFHVGCHIVVCWIDNVTFCPGSTHATTISILKFMLKLRARLRRHLLVAASR